MIDDTFGDALSRYAKVNEIVIKDYGQTCLDVSYSNLINQLKAVSWNDIGVQSGC